MQVYSSSIYEDDLLIANPVMPHILYFVFLELKIALSGNI